MDSDQLATLGCTICIDGSRLLERKLMKGSAIQTVLLADDGDAGLSGLADLFEQNWPDAVVQHTPHNGNLLEHLKAGSCNDVVIASISDRRTIDAVDLVKLVEASADAKLVLILGGFQIIGATCVAEQKACVSADSSRSGVGPAAPTNENVAISFGGGEASLELTNRETQTLALVMEGKTNKEIAYALGISPATVKVYIKSLMRKAKVCTRTELVIVGLANCSKEEI